ncbi:unnamed protein product [Orchesella dallaii]|uniref:Follistatin-related protein 1 EF-hand domain-containing protein n=1 Tax=Orchesella dallaii TaxID=48710 RepID=A0ABP1Q9S0_9HEXA
MSPITITHILVILVASAVKAQEERVAPGVPPVKYEQEQTTEKLPTIPQDDHDHHHEHRSDMFDSSNIDKERDHIQRHMSVPIDTSKMSENELQFHYFKMYDTDNNDKLDGCELMKSVLHWHDDQLKNATGDETKKIPKTFSDETLAGLVDPLIIRGDNNKDGFIDYAEYQLAQMKKR